MAARGLDDLEAANQDIRKLGQAQARANGLCGDGCFVRGTLVDTRDGPRPIEEIRPGDVVTARDQLTGEVEERQVVQTFEHADSAVVEVTYVDAQGKVETLGATPDHPFHVDGVGWVEAGKLLPGQHLTGLDGDYLVVQHVALDEERHTTYNFEVGEFHTYFVGNGDAWVHNAGLGKIVLGHFPAYVLKAKDIGAQFLDIPKPVWDKLSDGERWAANKRFLDRAILRGDDIILATPIGAMKEGPSYYREEIDYLHSRGYTASEDGKQMVRAALLCK